MMSNPWNASEASLARLQQVLDSWASIDWRAFSFRDASVAAEMLRGYAEPGLAAARPDDAALVAAVRSDTHPEPSVPEELLGALKAYQRLLRVLPPGAESHALPLLRAGVHSAIQIAALPPHEFARRWDELFPGEAALGERVHRNALTRRTHLALCHVQKVELNQPHYVVARFR
jgi:hypothetical protein